MTVVVFSDSEATERRAELSRESRREKWLAPFPETDNGHHLEPITVADNDYDTCARCTACVPLGWSHTCPDRIDPRRIALQAS